MRKVEKRQRRGNRRERSTLSCVIVADYYQVLLCAYGQPPPSVLINNSYINESRTNTAADHHSQTMTGESGLCWRHWRWLREDVFQQMLGRTFMPGVAHGDQTAELKPLQANPLSTSPWMTRPHLCNIYSSRSSNLVGQRGMFSSKFSTL